MGLRGELREILHFAATHKARGFVQNDSFFWLAQWRTGSTSERGNDV
jgi:hypothetical protein